MCDMFPGQWLYRADESNKKKKEASLDVSHVYFQVSDDVKYKPLS